MRVTCEVDAAPPAADGRGGAGHRVRHRDQDEPAAAREADRLALLAGLRDGTIDCIATDHAPHTVDDKKVEFDQAAFGIVGLETAVALCLDQLVRPGVITLPRLVALLSTHPARVLGLPGGSLAVGSIADVTVLDLERERTVDPARFQTKGRNTPYGGWTLRGWPVATIVAGAIVWQDVAGPAKRKQKARPRPARSVKAGRRRAR